MLQKTESMFDYYLDSVRLQAPCDFIKIGSVVQLIAPEFPNPIAKYAGLPMALSLFLDANKIRRIQTLSTECDVSVAPSIRPCRRNSFVIRRFVISQSILWSDIYVFVHVFSGNSENQPGKNLLYGENFHLQLVEPDVEGNPLVLYSSMKMMNLQPLKKTMHSYYKNGEINQTVGVCNLPVSLLMTLSIRQLKLKCVLYCRSTRKIAYCAFVTSFRCT